jgi:hypothetical protein
MAASRMEAETAEKFRKTSGLGPKKAAVRWQTDQELV